jgi:DNA repair protein RecO (recombination protein O)
MASLTVQAVVLRAADYKDYDRILTLFAREHGAIAAAARYCRRLKSPLLNAAAPFVAGEFVLTERQGRHTVASCSVEDAHYDLRVDPIKLACASYLCALCEEAVQPGQSADRLYVLLRQALAYLCYGEQEPLSTALCFLMRMLDEQGIGPVLTHCSRCGQPLDEATFDPHGAGALCGRCAPWGSRVEQGLLGQIDALRAGPFDPPPDIPPGAFDLIASYVTSHFERSFKALSFLEKMRTSY